MIPQLLTWARRIQALAQSGLTYGRDPYDRERYQELQEIAAHMMVASSTDGDIATVQTLFAQQHGYATPKVGVRAVVFDDVGRLLLVRENTDGGWTPPGGWADVGDSPSQVAIREVAEESGYQVRVTRLLGVLDRDKQGHSPIPWHVYNIYFMCEVVAGVATPSSETSAVAWFDRQHIPPLSLDRVQPHLIDLFFAYYDDPTLPAAFD